MYCEKVFFVVKFIMMCKFQCKNITKKVSSHGKNRLHGKDIKWNVKIFGKPMMQNS